MKIGIVGSSKADVYPHMRMVESIINNLMIEFRDITFISGGAHGIDSLVDWICKRDNIKMIEFIPKTYNWAGFRARNILIAKESDLCVSIALKGCGCYHCKTPDHEKTAGCWTRNYAQKLGKQVRTFII